MTQRFFFLALSVILSMSTLWAKPRTETQARLIAKQYTIQRLSSRELASLRSGTTPLLTLVSAPTADADGLTVRQRTMAPTVQDQTAAYYVYNIGTERGYVMVSGDDLLPEVIAYADAGAFLPDEEQPEHIASFLAQVRASLQYLVERGKPVVMPRTSQLRPEGVKPLLDRIQWGQDYPFNMHCPDKNGGKSVVGCVATAISQILRYHQWPDKGVGICEYKEDDGTEHRVDFSQTTYLWRNMPERPNQRYEPQDVTDALSTLCYHVGVLSHMQYSPAGSGTFTQYPKEGLSQYLKYSKNIQLLNRMNYKIADWMDIIAKELNEGRPVYYAGASSTVGHAFVCDGYRQNGYFHINFGWNGMADGFFLLYAITPRTLGTGGGSSYDGYNNLQEIMIGIEPDRDGSSERTVSEDISALALAVSCDDNKTIELKDVVLELGSAVQYKTQLCLAITPTQEGAQSKYGALSEEQELEFHNYYIYSEKSLHPVPSVDLTDLGLPTQNASYVVTLAYVGNGGKLIPVRHYNGGVSEVTVTFDSDGKAHCTSPQMKPKLALSEIKTPDLRGYSRSSVTLFIDNLSQEEYFSSWNCYFEDMKGDHTFLGAPSALLSPQVKQEIPLKVPRLSLPAGTKGNILLKGSYIDADGNDQDYILRSRQQLEVLPAKDPVYKASTLKCVARRSLTGAIEYAPGVHDMTFEVSNLGKLSRGRMLIQWALVQTNLKDSDTIRYEGHGFIETLKKDETRQYTIKSSQWTDVAKGSDYYLIVQLYDIVEDFGVNRYGEKEGELNLPIAIVDQLSPAIDEEHYVSLEKESDRAYPLKVNVATPSMIRLNGLSLTGMSHKDGVYHIDGRASDGRTAIIGAFSSLEFDQKDGSTGIIEADFSHASPLLQHVSIYHSKIRGEAMTEMLQSLPDRSATTPGTIAVIDTSRPDLEGSICTPEQVALAAQRGWTVTDQQGNAYTAIDTPAEATPGDWTIYPMPVRDQMTVVGLPATSPVMLYTLQGERLLETVTPASGQLQLSLTHLPSGTYILTTALGSRRIVVAH